jgi:hypothetical protein
MNGFDNVEGAWTALLDEHHSACANVKQELGKPEANMTEPSASQPAPLLADASIFGPGKLTQLLVLFAVGASCALFWLAARAMDVPREPRFGGSLLQSYAGVGWLAVALVLLAICAAIGTLLAGRRLPLAGAFAATVGLAVWSARGGAMQYALFNAQNSGIGRTLFFRLLLELLVLCAGVAAIWNVLWFRAAAIRPAGADPRGPVASGQAPTAGSDSDESRSTGAALLAQIGLTALLLFLLLIETSVKKQVMVSVFLASMAGSMLAESFFATRTSWRWYWVGPTAVGVIGYIAAWIQPTGMDIGHLSGALAPLARALPLDYASLGCAGALAGYWFSMPEAEPSVVSKKAIE